MGALIAKAVFKNGDDEISNKYSSCNEIPVKSLHGEDSLIGDNIQGKKLYMVVNVASKWGLTHKNYSQLVQIHEEFKNKGFEILAFPCNQFGA